ncbi:DUF4145 domain-containing protein [Rhodohalobacter mucosus]|uniref:DUF4145 domain-containing protein n=1 Tax=Rhodohalobacter mucosus TaxID=2079485 RepID=A0A316TWD7_9BACT|nr:DUF4145 domain-containing protein [Rhodohalobacter mucosus]PWN06864.1 hypothetical protein DDZ15_06200 [Rhodohalobacter mucosus]
MQLINKSKVKKWSVISGKIKVPKSISTNCPHNDCRAKVTFSVTDLNDDKKRNAVAASANCPDCNRKVHFWTLRDETNTTSKSEHPADIYMYPPASNFYPNPEFIDDIPEPLQRSLISTIDSYNGKNYVATAVGCRRTLEGIFKYLLPKEKRNEVLAKLINYTKEEVDLAAPLSSLSHAIRDGGNLGAHFDMEKEPDENMARQMVELIDYLISYLYVLPKEIEKLEESLAKGK